MKNGRVTRSPSGPRDAGPERRKGANAALRARIQQQKAVADLGLRAIQERNLENLFRVAAETVATTLDARYSAIAQMAETGEAFTLRAGMGWRQGLVGVTAPAAGTPAEWLMRHGEPVLIADARSETRFPIPTAMMDHGVVSAIYVAIRGRDSTWGSLSAYMTEARAFSADDIAFLESVANLLSLAIEHQDLERVQREDQEILQAVFDNIPVMISFYDASARILRANRAWEQTLGWSVKEAQQLDMVAAAYPDPDDRRAALQFMGEAERRWGEFRTTTRSGRVIDTSWIRYELSDGSKMGFGLDISEQKRAQAERERLLDSERRARAEAEATLLRLHTIQEITDSALAHADVDDLMAALLARLRQILKVRSATVMLLDPEAQEIYPRTWAGEFVPDIATVRIPVGQALSGRIVAEGRAMIINDGATLNITGVTGTAHMNIGERQSMLGAPLVVGGHVIGALVAADPKPRCFTEDDLEIIQLVADRMGPAIERARLASEALQAQERLSALSHRLLSAQEEERRRLAVELHDELGQTLTAVKIKLETLARAPAALPLPLNEAIESVDQALQRVRDLALDLRPSVLDDLGLPPALRWYADRFARAAGCEVHLSIDAVPELGARIETTCFRVAQEALTNVGRHACARNVWLDLHLMPSGLELRVRDDGTGFDYARARVRAARGESLGLLGMEERVSLAGGELEVRTSPRAGTAVVARFPVRDRERRFE